MVALHNGIYIFGDFCIMVAVSWHLWIFLLNVNRTALFVSMGGLGSLHFVTVCSVCIYINIPYIHSYYVAYSLYCRLLDYNLL